MTQPLPIDYAERVYAGILGKIIGVYLGRPVEQWSYEAIQERFGEIRYYVNDQMKMPLILTDDDITGTFTFVRALADHGYDPNLTPGQIGDTWLNYIIENRTILWWGGLGNSTEHTAYLRLKAGIRAPESGSMRLNTRAVAEEIGAQIFVDGWAMVNPGNPERAADFARRAASVSHDGEAIYGAQVIAAMESLAFSESDLNKLLDTALGLIPPESEIARMAAGLRELHRREPDWRKALMWIRREWGYERYRTNCPMVSNHAVVLLGLLYGGDNFQRAMLVTNSAGYDTDCNAANVGCLLGIKNGLGMFSAKGQPNWRGPVADRLFLPTADGGRSVTDAVQETYHIVNAGRALAGLGPVNPKEGAQYHFSLPGSTQGWRQSLESGPTQVSNRSGQLAISFSPGSPVRVEGSTFTPPDALYMPGYTLFASPTLYSGQLISVSVCASPENTVPVTVTLTLRRYSGKADTLLLLGPNATLAPGETKLLEWTAPDCEGHPICNVGIEISNPTAHGIVLLDRVAWRGSPRVQFFNTKEGGHIWWQNSVGRPAWQLQWVDAADGVFFGWGGEFHIVQNRGRGLISTGSDLWTDYRVHTEVTPSLMAQGGLAFRYQGLERYYAFEFVSPGSVRLVKRHHGETQIWSGALPGEWASVRHIAVTAVGPRLSIWMDHRLLVEHIDTENPYLHGGIAIVVCDGRIATGPITVEPA